MAFAGIWDGSAPACCDSCCLCLCMVPEGQVSDLMVCWRPVDHCTCSPSAQFSSSHASTVAVGLLLLLVTGNSVSKENGMSTS